MNLKFINEYINLLAILFGCLPLFFSLLHIKRNLWVKFLFGFLLFITLLDIINFYFYKFEYVNLSWIPLTYFLSSVIFFPFCIHFSIRNIKIRNTILYFQFTLFILLFVRLIYNGSILEIDEWSWLILQLTFSIISLLLLTGVIKNPKITLLNNPLFYLYLGFLVLYFAPLYSTFAQKQLSQYFQLSYIVLNISAILGYLLLFLSVKKVTH